ncbi:MAG: hypothetical protein HY901_07895 [Deltaproteobacteria bacterium]|nr:hypothetical protein [Deltaproteobacteria bacterium]
MFRHLLREMEDLSGTTSITIPVAADERGYVDKECPVSECRYQFKVMGEDWGALFHDEAVFCPMCGHEAPATQLWTTEQVEQGRARAMAYLEARVDSALRRGAAEFNRTHRSDGFLQVSMHVSGAPRRAVILPLPAAEVLEQRVACEKCSARYAVIGAAFFCPCCGNNSVERMFEASLQRVRARVENLDTIRSALREASGPDDAELTCRSLLEDGLQHCVTAFQHYAERRYRAIPGTATPRMNAFQRLEEGDALWRAAVGAGYIEWISPDSQSRLRILFERRHLLAHRDGIVDDKYMAKSGDHVYRTGQRIVVTVRDVSELVDIIQRLADAIRAATEPKDGAPTMLPGAEHGRDVL